MAGLFKPNQPSGVMDPSALPDLPLSDEESAVIGETSRRGAEQSAPIGYDSPRVQRGVAQPSAVIDPKSLPDLPDVKDLPDLPGVKDFAQTEYNRLQAERDRISPHSMRFLGLFKNRAMRDADRAVKEHYNAFKDQLGAGQQEMDEPGALEESTVQDRVDWMKGPWGSPGSLGEGLRKDMASVVSGAASGETSLLHPAAWAFDKAANAAGLLPKDRPSAFSRYVQGLAHTAKVYQDAAGLQGTGQEIVGGLASAAGSFATGLPAAVGAIKGAGAIPGMMSKRLATAAAAGAPEMAVALPAGVSQAGASWAAPVGLAALGAYLALPSEDYHAVARAAVEGLGMGGMFNATAALHPLLRAPVQSAGFAGLAAAGGANRNETITQGVLGAALAVPGTAYEDLVRKGAPALAKSITDSTWYRKMTNPERALVVQDVGQQIAGMRAQGMPPDLILKNLANTAAATSPEYVATVKVRAAGGNANAVQDVLETVSEMRRAGSTDAEIVKAIDEQIAQQRLSGQDTGQRPGEGEQPGSQAVPGAPGPGMAFDVRSGQWIPAETGQYSGSLREQAPPSAPVTPRAARFVAIADQWMREAARHPEGSPERNAAMAQAEAAMQHARMEQAGNVSRGGAEAQSGAAGAGENGQQSTSSVQRPTTPPAPSSAQGILERAADPAAVDAVVAAGSTAPIQEAQRIAAAQAQADAHAAQAAAVLQAEREERDRRGQLEQNYKNAKDRLARSSRNAGGGDQSGLTGDATGLMVTYAKQAGFVPMRVYRDLRDMGVPQANAIREVMKGWPDFVPTTRPGALEGAEEYSLVDAIRDLGGIAPYRTHKGVRQASLHKDFSAIPLWLRDSDGTPIDEALRQLEGMGFHFETESELAEAIGKSAGRLDVERNPVKAQERHDESEAEDYADWEKRGSTLVPIGSMQEGDTFSVMGQRMKVVEVGDQALHVRNVTSGQEGWIPYEYVQDVRIDSGSLKRPEEARQSNLPLSAAATRPAVARAENASSAVLPDAGREAVAGSSSKPRGLMPVSRRGAEQSSPIGYDSPRVQRGETSTAKVAKGREGGNVGVHPTPETELHLGDQVEATLANGQPVVGTVVGADAGGNAVVQPHDGGEKVTVPEPVVGPADREQGGEHAIHKRSATALDVENKPGNGPEVGGRNAEGNEVAGARPAQEAGLSAKGEVGGTSTAKGAKGREGVAGDGANVEQSTSNVQLPTAKAEKIAKARKALIPKSKKEREAEGLSQTSEKAPPEGWPVPEVLDLRIGSGQPQQFPGMAEGLTYNTYTRKNEEEPWKVVIARTSGDMGFSSVFGTGKTRADAYVAAAWAFQDEVLKRTAERIKRAGGESANVEQSTSNVQRPTSDGGLNLNEADRARLAEIQEKLRARLAGKGLTPGVKETGAEYAGGDVSRRGAEAQSAAFDPENATLAGEMATLYAKGGMTKFAEFAAAVKRDMPDAWDGINRYLHGAWVTAGTGNAALDEVSRAQAAEAIGEASTAKGAKPPSPEASARQGGREGGQSEAGGGVEKPLQESTEKDRGLIEGSAGGRNLMPPARGAVDDQKAYEDRQWASHLKSIYQLPVEVRQDAADLFSHIRRVLDARTANGFPNDTRAPVWVRNLQDVLSKVTAGAEVYTAQLRKKEAGHKNFQPERLQYGIDLEKQAIQTDLNQPEYRPVQVDKLKPGKSGKNERGETYTNGRSTGDKEGIALIWSSGDKAEPLYWQASGMTDAEGPVNGFSMRPEEATAEMRKRRDENNRNSHDLKNKKYTVAELDALPAHELRTIGFSRNIPQYDTMGLDKLRGEILGQQDQGTLDFGLQSAGTGGTLSTEGGKQSGRRLMPPARGGQDNGRVQPTLPTTDAETASPGVGGAGGETPSGQGAGGGRDDSLRLRGGGVGGLPDSEGRTSSRSGGSSGTRQEPVGTGSDAASSGSGIGVQGGEHGVPERGDRVGAGGAGAGVEGRNPSAGGSGTAGAVAGVESNYRITAADDFGGTGAVTKARANLAALRLLKKLNAEGRPATPEEKTALARYVGWGNSGLKNTMFPLSGRESVLPEAGSEESSNAATFRPLAQELRDLLTPEEYETARRSVQYAHYTVPTVVRAMWSAVQRLGFDGGRVLEPGSGVGRFVGLIPDDLVKPGRVRFTGVEMDGVSADISRLLYPKADMRHGDFVEFPYLGEVFDLAIGNPPFSERRVTADPRYAKAKMVLHDYFIRKSLDMVKPGGLVVLVTSHGTMDKKNDTTREMIAKHADLLGAIRLPQSAFYKDAGTKVVTDILFLRKRFPGQELGGESWQSLGSVPTDDGDAWVNEYYAAHPEMVLGTHSLAGRMRFGGGKEYTVLPLPDTDGGIDAALEKAVGRLPELRARPPAKAPAGDGGVSRGGAGVQHGQAQGELPVTGADDTARTLAVAPGEMLNGAYNLLGDQLVLTDGRVHTPILPQSQRPRKGALVLSSDTHAQPPVYVSKEQIGVIKHYMPIRDAVRRVLALQSKGTDSELAAAQQEMARAYRLFSLAHGPINQRKVTLVEDADGKPVLDEHGHQEERVRWPIREAIDQDVFHGAVLALEGTDDNGKFTGKLSKLFTERLIGVPPETKIETPADALGVVMREQGRPDLAAVAALLGVPEADAEKSLAGRVYRDPESGNWVVSEKYLSGNVKEKLEQARAKAATDPRYEANVRALEASQPAELPPSRIKLNLGMPIIPPADIEQFMREVGGVSVRVTYNKHVGSWLADDVYAEGHVSVATRSARISRFGTQERTAGKVLTSALNGKPIQVTETDPDGTVHVLPEATAAANQKVSELLQGWNSWVFADPGRMQRLSKAFNDTFNVWRNENWNGDHLTFPGMSKDVIPYPHQKGLAWRVIQQGNTYAVHEVGLGKTMAAAMTAMELRRLGLAKKIMVVVPNHMLGQWNSDFHQAYPAATILLADEDQFTPKRRQRFLGRIVNGDHDAVVITHSAFKLIDVSPETEKKHIEEEIDRFRRALEDGIGRRTAATGKRGRGGDKQDPRRRQIELSIEKLQDRLKALSNMRRDKGLVWDNLGVDQLIVDEAHEYRKLRFATTRRGLKGIDPDGSERSWDLYMKGRTITDRTPGRGLLFLSGTPIVNTMGEVFTVQRMMQQQALDKLGVGMFDPWVTTFGAPETKFEKTPGKGYASVTRLAHWMNMTLLSGMWQQIGDYRRFDDLPYMKDRRPKVKGGSMQAIVANESPTQKTYRERVIEERIRAIKKRHGKPQPGDDIILSVITDAKHAAMDERFISPSIGNNPEQKLERMIQDVLRIYRAGEKDKRTQLVFMDLGLPQMLEQRGFSAYLRLRDALIAGGIHAHEIAFKNDFKKRSDMDRLQEMMNSGQMRVLIGSMAAMGTGLNVQKRLFKAHFVTIPWYPALVEQAVGRIVRQGNSFPEVELAAYMTAGTIEEYMWGLNETKSRWIHGFFRGAVDEMGGELDSESDNYALLRCLSSADPRVQQLDELQAKLAQIQMLERAHLDTQSGVMSDIRTTEHYIQGKEDHAAFLKSLPKPPDTTGDAFAMTVGDASYTDRGEAGSAILQAAIKAWAEDWKTDPNKPAIKIGSFGSGYDVDASKYLDDIMLYVNLKVDVPGVGERALHVVTGSPSSPLSSNGILQSLEGALRSVNTGKQLEATQLEIQELQESLKEVKARLSPWTRGDEANGLRRQIQDLQAEIAKDSKDDEEQPQAGDDVDADGSDDADAVHETPGEYNVGVRSMLPPARSAGVAQRGPVGRSLMPSAHGLAGVREASGFLDFGQRGPAQDAVYADANPAKAWPAGFPNVATETSVSSLTAHPDYTAAKAGDVYAAGRLVLALAKPEKARSLAQRFPGATLVPVHAVEASGMNKLPVVYATHLSHVTGMPVNVDVVQTNAVMRTGRDRWHRLAMRPTFDGQVESGRDYLLVDDVVTGGGSLSELRRYIEAHGGRVVGATTLAAAQFSQNLALSVKTRLALETAFGVDSLHDFLKSEGIYGGEHSALTESEARTLLAAPSLDSARDLLAEARLDAGASTGRRVLPPSRSRPGAQGVVETPGEYRAGGEGRPQIPQIENGAADWVLRADNAVVTVPTSDGDGNPMVREPVGVAYHGTPHTFEPEPSAPLGRFKKEKVGTGEGAAAYGWGVAYLAQNPLVAKQYVEDLRGMFYEAANPQNKTRDAAKLGEKLAAGAPGVAIDDARLAGVILGRQLQDGEPLEIPKDSSIYVQKAYRILVGQIKFQPGNLYHVEVTADRDRLLDWNVSAFKQSEYVQKALAGNPETAKWLGREYDTDRPYGTFDGGSLYARLANEKGKKGASDLLASLGIKGIRYADQGSRFSVFGQPVFQEARNEWYATNDNGDTILTGATKEDVLRQIDQRRTFNYVIFNESDIRVVGRNGKVLTPTQAVKESQAKYSAGKPARSMLPPARSTSGVREPTPTRSMLPAPRSVMSVPDVVSQMQEAVRWSLGAQADNPESKAAIESLKVSIPKAMAASDKPYQMDLFENATEKMLARFKRSEAQKKGRQRREDAARDARIEAMRVKLEKLRVDHPEMWHRSAIEDAMGTTGEGRLPLTLHEAVWKVPITPLYLSHPDGYQIHSARDIAALTWALRTPTHERFVVCAIDKGGKLLAARVVSVGILDSTLVSPSIVFGWLPAGTVAIACTHNHPSGDPTPSPEDIKLTRQLIEAGNILGIPLVDHVPTNGRYISMKDAGLSSLSFPLRPFRSKPNTPENELPGSVKEDEKYVTDPYGVVSENYNLAEWEVVPSTMLPGIHLPGHMRKVVEPVERSAEPGKWVHVVHVNTKNKTLAVERVAGDRSIPDISQRVLRSAMEVPGVSSIAVTFNWQGSDVNGMVHAIQRAADTVGIRVLDYLDHAYLSRQNDPSIWNQSPGLSYDPAKAAETVNGDLASAAAEAKVAETDGEYSGEVSRRGAEAQSGMVRETPAGYGDRPTEFPVGPDGEPDWDRYATELRQKYAAAVQAEQELRRASPRRIEITRAIERDKMSRLSREMSSLRRRVAKANEAKAIAKEKGKVLQAQAVKTVARMAADEYQKMFGSSPTRGETLGDLLRETLEQGRQKGLAQKSRRDIRSAIRDALNERTKRLMAHSDLPTNWNEITASRNANMLAALNQIRESMKGVPADQRVGAAAAEVRRLLGGGKDVDEAISGLEPGDYESLLTGTGDALARDLRAYYRREIGRLFGGRPTTVTLPSGDVAKRKTVGVVHAGLSRMTDAPRAAMQEIIQTTPWDSLNTLTWEDLRSIVDRAKRYLAEDQANKEFIKEGHKIRRADASDAAAREIEAAREPLEASRTASPEHGTWKQRQAWSRSSPGTQALLLTGGDEDGAAYVVLSGNLIDANERQLNLEASDNLALEEKMKGLGITRDDLLKMDYVFENVDLPGDRTVELTRGEMMTLYGIMQDADAREKVLHNGWLPSRRRHVESKYIIRGEGKTYEERLADSEAIVQAVVGRLSPAERTVVEWMTHEMASEWGRRANETSRIVAGVSLFGDGPHFTLAGSIAREAELPNVDDPAGLQQHMVDRWGGAKERQAHSNALFLRPFLSVFRQQARDMSTYTAWSVPYRDAISMLSRGRAKSAIVERWGTTVLGDMKDSLAYLTYQKGHTDDYKGGKQILQALERNASAHILGASLTTIAKNRYAGALDMAKMISVEGGTSGPDLARKYLARVLAPAVGMERTRDPARRAIKDRLMKEGYFWDRWGRHAFRVFGQLSSQRMEVDEHRRMLPAGRNDGTDPMKGLRRSQGWKDFQTLMLSGMQHAEIANVIDAWQTMEAAGWTPERIIPAVIRWTRRTQNPSTPMEHSYQYTWVRKSGFGLFVPFLGQPSVVTDQWQAEALKAKKTGNWKRLALFRFGTLAALAMSVLIGLLYRRAQKNMLGAGNPSDKKEAREVFNTVDDALGQAAQLVNPVVGGRVVGWGLPTLWAMVSGDMSMIPQGARDESLLGGIVSECNNATRLLVKGIESGEITQVQVEKLAISTHRLAGELTGLPTGGIEKGIRAAAGAVGEPIGVAEDKETGAKSGIGAGYKRPKPLMPAKHPKR